MLFGADAFITYVETVIPSTLGNRSAWGNLSLPSLSLKLFSPERAYDSIPVFQSRFVGYALALGAEAVVALVIVRRSLQAKTPEQHDWALALAIAGMLLASPITWGSYFVLLLLPLTLIWNAPKSILVGGAFAVATLILWVPLQSFMLIPMGGQVMRNWSGHNLDLPPPNLGKRSSAYRCRHLPCLSCFISRGDFFPKPPIVENDESGDLQPMRRVRDKMR